MDEGDRAVDLASTDGFQRVLAQHLEAISTNIAYRNRSTQYRENRRPGASQAEGYTTSNVAADRRLKLWIEEMIGGLPQRSRDCCIYRVPEWLRDFDRAAYTPEVVSIGPFHSMNPNLQAMIEQKLRYMQTFIGRFNGGGFESCIRVIREREESIRHYYAERIEWNSDEFVVRILLDAAFVVESIVSNQQHDEEPCVLVAIRKDMILLENQIPFFILDLLFKLACPRDQRSFIEISIAFFQGFFLVEGLKYPSMLPPEYVEVKHFVDLLRLCHLPSTLTRRETNYSATRFRICSATKLGEVGMKFRKSSSRRLLDIKYDDKMETLEIPPFAVSNYTGFVLKNMVALEQFHYGLETYITDYVIFMDALIDTAEDVDLLIEKKIIENFRGDSHSVSKVFNNFTDEVTFYFDSYYYNDISQRLNRYCEDSWNTWRSALKRDYCRTPWMMASTIAAILLLLLTFIQAVSSVFSFFPSNK